MKKSTISTTAKSFSSGIDPLTYIFIVRILIVRIVSLLPTFQEVPVDECIKVGETSNLEVLD